MRLLLVNQDWFATELRELGHEVRTCGSRESFDVRPVLPVQPIEAVLKLFEDGWRPEGIIVHDNSSPVRVVGLEYLDVPTLFYSVDTHHHHEWHRYYAHVFNHLCVAQKDYIPILQQTGVHPRWLPLYASEIVEPAATRDRGAVFVGTLNRKLNPERVEFFEKLREQVRVEVIEAWWQVIFPSAEIVINQTVRGDLNFRIFEGMVAGALMLTEDSGNGLHELFRAGEHLVTYEKGNVAEAAEIIRYYSAHPTEARKIAEAGRAEVLARHLPMHRAQKIDGFLRAGSAGRGPACYFGAAVNLVALARRLQNRDKAGALQALVLFGRAVQHALERGEKMNDEISFSVVTGAVAFDLYFGGDAGARLLHACSDAYPELPALRLGAIKCHSQRGAMTEARALASSFGNGDEQAVFLNADKVIDTLMENMFSPYE